MNNLLEKWKTILDSEQAPKFRNKKIKNATAHMLENQFKYLEKNHGLKLDEAGQYSISTIGQGETNRTAGYPDDGYFHKIAIPMVRRTFPELIAHDIVGVQPLTGPVGLAFAMRFVSGQEYAGEANKELGFNTIDPTYTGPISTPDGEALGSNTSPESGLGIGDGTQIKEVNMTLEKDQVEAKTRKLRSRWSIEVAQDVENMHGLNLEEEMMDVLSYEITAEIDRELIGKIRDVTGTAHGNYSVVDFDEDLDGRWEAEKFRNLYNLIIRKANSIAKATRRGPGNWIVADPDTCAALETLPAFNVHPINADINTAQFGVTKVGNLDARLNLYRDTFHDENELLIGFKGVSEYDTGVVYLPYVQLMLSKTIDYASFQPAIGLLSRYAVHNHIFGAKNYYQRIRCNNMWSYVTTS